MNCLAVVGAGSWGTALAITLASRFERVVLWARDPARAAEMGESGENRRYLPGFRLPENVHVTSRLEEAARAAGVVLIVVPSRYVRPILEQVISSLAPEAVLVSATKGIENETLLRMSEVVAEVAGPARAGRIAVLSGPTFAKEIAAGEPAAVVVAAEDESVAKAVQNAFHTPTLRLYASNDVIGVELGAALKNVIAIGAGVCQGLGRGSNTVAALITRGLAEVTRLALVSGGKARTLSGLAGLGDLVLTCTGELSRNRYVGLQLALGRSLDEISSTMTQIAEGVETCRAAYTLSRRRGVDMPITDAVHQILYGRKPPPDAIRELMERPLTIE